MPAGLITPSTENETMDEMKMDVCPRCKQPVWECCTYYLTHTVCADCFNEVPHLYEDIGDIPGLNLVDPYYLEWAEDNFCTLPDARALAGYVDIYKEVEFHYQRDPSREELMDAVLAYTEGTPLRLLEDWPEWARNLLFWMAEEQWLTLSPA